MVQPDPDSGSDISAAARMSNTFSQFSQLAGIDGRPCRWPLAALPVVKGLQTDVSIHRIAINFFLDFLSSFPDKVQSA
jgi:hypothetical protein